MSAAISKPVPPVSSNAESDVADKNKDTSAPRTPNLAPVTVRDAHPNGAPLALNTNSSARDTFLEDGTPATPRDRDRERDKFRGVELSPSDGRDSHDLAISPRQGNRDSLVDNMLLSLDQFGTGPTSSSHPMVMGAATHADDEVMNADFRQGGSDVAVSRFNFPRLGRRRGHTHSSSYSSENDAHLDDNPNRFSTQLSRGRRSNSSSNFQSVLERIDSFRGGDRARARGWDPRNDAALDHELNASSRGRQRRESNDSRGSSSINADYVHAYEEGRPSSFDQIYSERAIHSSPAPVVPRQRPVDFDDSDAAPTPTVPGGPRSQFGPFQQSAGSTQQLQAFQAAPAAEKKKSGKVSSKWGYGRKDRADSRPSTSRVENRRAAAHPKDLPPIPSSTDLSAPAPTVSFGKSSEPNFTTTSPPKERRGFFSRVFASTQSASPSNRASTAPPFQPAPDIDLRSQYHLGGRNTTQFFDDYNGAADTSSDKELPPVPPPLQRPTITKKSSSFFRRRKKSVSETTFPPPPSRPPPEALASSSSPDVAAEVPNLGALNTQLSPKPSIRRVVQPHTNRPASPLNSPISPLQTFYDTKEDFDARDDDHEADFAGAKTPNWNATIRALKADATGAARDTEVPALGGAYRALAHSGRTSRADSAGMRNIDRTVDNDAASEDSDVLGNHDRSRLKYRIKKAPDPDETQSSNDEGNISGISSGDAVVPLKIAVDDVTFAATNPALPTDMRSEAHSQDPSTLNDKEASLRPHNAATPLSGKAKRSSEALVSTDEQTIPKGVDTARFGDGTSPNGNILCEANSPRSVTPETESKDAPVPLSPERPHARHNSKASDEKLIKLLGLPLAPREMSQGPVAVSPTESDYKSACSLPLVQTDDADDDDDSGEVERPNVVEDFKVTEGVEDVTDENAAEESKDAETPRNEAFAAAILDNEPTDEDRSIARDLFENEEGVVGKANAAAWLGEMGADRAKTRTAYMDLFDWTNLDVLTAMRGLCGKIALKGESQQVDRLLDAVSRRWCECNPNHGFKATDVVHTICYSVLLLNTDLHLADIEQKMTRNQFIRNTMPTVRRVAADAAPDAFDTQRMSTISPPGPTPSTEPSSPGLTAPPTINIPDRKSSLDVDQRPFKRFSRRPSQLEESTLRCSTPLDNDATADDCGPLVKAPFQGSIRAWEAQVELVLKDFYNSIRQQRLPLRGAEPQKMASEQVPSSNSLSVLTNSMLKRTPSTMSKANSEHTSVRGRPESQHRPSTGRWTSKARSRPRLYPSSTVGSSRTSFDEQSTMWSPSNSSTWSKYSLNKTQTSMSVDSFSSAYPQGDYKQSIGFANALSQAIIREEAAGTASSEPTTAPLLEDETLGLAGAPWAKEGILKHKHHLESVDKRAKDRNWSECFAVIEKGWMRLFSFSAKSSVRSRNKARQQMPGGVVGGGNWSENAEALGSFLLRQTIASALPPPGYSKARPHVWALSLPTGAVHLFQVGTPEIVKEFVSTANYWSARLSKEPLVGGVSNMEYGWSADVVNNALLSLENLRPQSRPPSASATGTRPSLQSSLRSSIDQGVSGRARMPADKLTISDWKPPQQSMMASSSPEAEQLKALLAYVKNIEEDLQKHNELRSPMLLAFSPRHPNSTKAMANWECKSSYLLREIVKFRTYIDCLTAAQVQKEKIYADRRARDPEPEPETKPTEGEERKVEVDAAV
ncbi:MAG: hypothetical protein M1825_005280 [Sarcosagium campestre]|nr:MAG: hypothetical protein M1825_005280 [Sarcosagium campestre]